jgi:hypothetical protein
LPKDCVFSVTPSQNRIQKCYGRAQNTTDLRPPCASKQPLNQTALACPFAVCVTLIINFNTLALNSKIFAEIFLFEIATNFYQFIKFVELKQSRSVPTLQELLCFLLLVHGIKTFLSSDGRSVAAGNAQIQGMLDEEKLETFNRRGRLVDLRRGYYERSGADSCNGYGRSQH